MGDSIYVIAPKKGYGTFEIWFIPNKNPQLKYLYQAVKVNTLEVNKIPLGGTEALTPCQVGKVFVPTKWGGKLSVNSKGTKLYYTDGTELSWEQLYKLQSGTSSLIPIVQGNNYEYNVPVGDNYGWYYLVAIDASITQNVSNTFTQDVTARKRPWNFYYWATKADFIMDGGNKKAETVAVPDDSQYTALGTIPERVIKEYESTVVTSGNNGTIESAKLGDDKLINMVNNYDVGGPLYKYDSIFNVSLPKARDWELNNHSELFGGVSWEGHCWGGAAASLLINDPEPVPGCGFSKEELKALWLELADTVNDDNYTVYVYDDERVSSIPEVDPEIGYDNADEHAPEYHHLLERGLCGDSTAFATNIRGHAEGEIWNYALFGYTAKYCEESGGKNRVKIEIEIKLNVDADTGSYTDSTYRTVIYNYILELSHFLSP